MEIELAILAAASVGEGRLSEIASTCRLRK